MSVRVRTAVGSAILTLAWSCNILAADVATIYSPLPEPEQGVVTLRLPPPQGHQFTLAGPFEESSPWITSPPGSEFESSLGGTRGRQVPSYGHMVFKGSAVIVGFELAMMGVMMMLPRESMNWESDFVADATHNLGRHVTSLPVWDDDNWKLNYVGHPYAGSLYYNTVRAQGASVWQSFLFAFGASTFWEYFVEATAEPASTQDLIVTPVGGAILGEVVHHLTLSMKKNGTTFLEGVAITLLNPTHVAMRGYR